MQISPEVLKNIKKIVFLEYEPNDRTVMWAKPDNNNQFIFLVYNNGAWQQLSSADGVTINVSDISVNLSAFNNDTGFITEDDIPVWAKQSTKPSYTASEVGAVAESVLSGYSEEQFVFTLTDNSTVTKTILAK